MYHWISLAHIRSHKFRWSVRKTREFVFRCWKESKNWNIPGITNFPISVNCETSHRVGVDRTQSYSSIVAHTIATFYEWFTIQFNQPTFAPLESSTSPFRSVYLHRILTYILPVFFCLLHLYTFLIIIIVSRNTYNYKPKIKISWGGY